MRENPEWAAQTFATMVGQFGQAASESIMKMLTDISGGSLEHSDFGHAGDAQLLEDTAVELERIARGLRAMKAHTKYPPEEAPPIESFVWAVSANAGRSLRVTESEFTARRYIKLTTANMGQYRVYRQRPNGPVPVPGTDIVFGSTDPATHGWELVARG